MQMSEKQREKDSQYYGKSYIQYRDTFVTNGLVIFFPHSKKEVQELPYLCWPPRAQAHF